MELKQEIRDTKGKELTHLSKTLYLSENSIIKNRGVWLIDSTKKPNIHELTIEDKQQIKEQVELSIKRRYRFISYNGQLTRADFFEKFTANGNPFNKSVVCIDEAHNVISGIVNRLGNNKTNAMRLYHLLMDAEIVNHPFIGTPLINYPNEIAVMSNILRGYIKTLEITLQNKGMRVEREFFENRFRKYGFVDYIEYKKQGDNEILTLTKHLWIHTS